MNFSAYYGKVVKENKEEGKEGAEELSKAQVFSNLLKEICEDGAKFVGKQKDENAEEYDAPIEAAKALFGLVEQEEEEGAEAGEGAEGAEPKVD